MKKWWKKTNIIVGTALIIGVLALSTALLTVSCGSAESGPTQPEEYVNNRPVKGFYYQYEDKDIDVMKEMIRYIYNNNPIKEKYTELDYYWPIIIDIKQPDISKPTVPINPEVFDKEYDDPIDRYDHNSRRAWRFDIYFEITDEGTQTVGPYAVIFFYDWLFSFTSQKYIDDVEFWRTSATDDSLTWSDGWGGSGYYDTWNAPLKFKYGPNDVLEMLFDLHYQYANAIDTWYIINQWKPSWPKTRQQYWDEMVNLNATRPYYWNDVLPITE